MRRAKQAIFGVFPCHLVLRGGLALFLAALVAGLVPGPAQAAPAAPVHFVRSLPSTPVTMTVFGFVTLTGGAAAPAGTEVGVFDPDGVLAGAGGIDASNGAFLVQIYGDDNTSTGVDEGALANDALTFVIYHPGLDLELPEAALTFSPSSFGTAPDPIPPLFSDRASYGMDIDANSSSPSIAIGALPSLTNQTTLTLSGTTDAGDGATVTVTVDTAAVGGNAVVTGDAWSLGVTGLVHGVNTFTASVANAFGIPGGSSASIEVDTAAPTVGIASVTSPTSQTSQSVEGTLEAEATVSLSVDTGATVGTVTYPTATTWAADLSGLAEGDNGVTVTATDVAGNSASASETIQVDTTAPVITIVTPAGIYGTATPPLDFAVAGGSIYEMTVTGTDENGDPVNLDVTGKTSGEALDALLDGSYVLTVRAEDAVLNEANATSSFEVNTKIPGVTIDAPLDGSLIRDNTPVLTFAVAGASVSVTVKVDGVSVDTVSGGSLGALSDGEHTVVITAPNAAGLSLPVSVTFTVDATAPVVTLTSPAAGIGNDNTPTLDYAVNDATATVVVTVDGATVATAGGAALAQLTDGAHTVVVTATDAAGNAGSASATFTVDTVVPAVTLTSPAASLGNDNTPNLDYAVDDATATVVVTVDGTTVATADGAALAQLTDGSHTLVVTATDAAGNAGSASVPFTVDATAPVVTLTSPAAGIGADNTPTLDYAVNDATATVVVTVDGATVATADGADLAQLTDGAHTVVVTATDAAANAGSASVSFTVDTVAPVVAISAVTSPTFQNSQSVSGTVDGTGSAALVVITADTAAVGGNATVTNGTWSFTVTALVTGNNTLTATATDAAGNTATATATIEYVPNPTATSAAITTLQGKKSQGVAPTVVFPFGSVQEYAGLEVLTQPANGTAAVESNRLVYTPNPEYVGNDSFTYRAIVDAANAISIDGDASVTVLEAVAVDQPVTQVTAGGVGSFTVSGGSGTYTGEVVTAPAGAGSALLTAGENGAFTFTAPTTGAFAGSYGVEIVDEASGLPTTVTFTVPLKISTSAVNILESDATQTVTVTGGAASDHFSFVAAAVEGAEGADPVAAVAATDAADDAENGNPAMSTIVPADVDSFTAFTLAATDETQSSLGPVATGTLTVVPEATYSGVVMDQDGAALEGAVVEALDVTRGDGSTYLVVTGVDGSFSTRLPQLARGEYRFGVDADGFVATAVDGVTLRGAAGTAEVVLLTQVAAISGTLSGLQSGDSAQLFAHCDTLEVGPLVMAGNGAFTLSLPDRNTICSQLLAVASGYNTAAVDNGGAGYDLSAGDIDGVMLTLTAVVVDRTGLAEGELGGTGTLDPTTLEDGFTATVTDATDPDSATQQATVAAPSGGLHLNGTMVTEASATVHTQVLSGMPGMVVEVTLLLRDADGNLLPTSGADNVVARLVITIPFDTSVVPVGSLESGEWVIYTASTLAEFSDGGRTALSPDAILAVDYLTGTVTFEVSHLSVFGVDEAPAPPPSSSGGGGGGGGCFVRSLFE